MNQNIKFQEKQIDDKENVKNSNLEITDKELDQVVGGCGDYIVCEGCGNTFSCYQDYYDHRCTGKP